MTPQRRGKETSSPEAELARALRVAEATLECSQALLRGTDDAAIDRAMAALLKASEASFAYVDINLEDPELGLCLETRYRAFREDAIAESEVEEFFGRVPWAQLPGSYEILSRGELFAVERIDEVDPRDRDLYETRGATVHAELAVPVMLDEEWVATVAVADVTPRAWSPGERQMMVTVADMFASFWRRERTEARLRDLLEAKERFVASVSHELRTPLAAVIGFATELHRHAEELDEETREELVGLIARESLEVGYIVEDLLVAARAADARLSILPTALDVANELETVISGLPANFGDQVKLRRVEDHRVWADPHRLRQILRNLIVNACRYGGDRCYVDVFRDDDRIVVAVADTGPGIPVERRKRIFEAYQSIGPATGPLPSIGLGLTVSRQLARLMGGDVRYEMRDESTFLITLPPVAAGQT